MMDYLYNKTETSYITGLFWCYNLKHTHYKSSFGSNVSLNLNILKDSQVNSSWLSVIEYII